LKKILKSSKGKQETSEVLTHKFSSNLKDHAQHRAENTSVVDNIVTLQWTSCKYDIQH